MSALDLQREAEALVASIERTCSAPMLSFERDDIEEAALAALTRIADAAAAEATAKERGRAAEAARYAILSSVPRRATEEQAWAISALRARDSIGPKYLTVSDRARLAEIVEHMAAAIERGEEWA